MITHRYSNPWDDRRQRMIDETGAWLTWALCNGAHLPRIPRRRVDQGGFERLLNQPGARMAVAHWWQRTLDLIETLH